jgi:N-acetyl-anhydromuramyl-L-alanine amidase AmpD
MVSDSDTAWHNGTLASLSDFDAVHSFVLGVISPNSVFNGRPNSNLWCIGVEFSRNVKNDNVMPELQIAAGVRLIADMKRRYKGIHI